jgi:hypothetical protein
MRKSVGLSLPVYILYLLGGIGLAIYHYIAAQNSDNWEPLGHVLIMIVYLCVAAVGLVGLIFKGIHIASGFGLFGFICALIDIAVIVFFVMTIASSGTGISVLPIVFISLSGISMISNFASMAR